MTCYDDEQCRIPRAHVHQEEDAWPFQPTAVGMGLLLAVAVQRRKRRVE